MGAAAGLTRKTQRTSQEHFLNPTQSIVPALLTQLPPDRAYHVYMDNPFSSPDLFVELRRRGIGATGTSRTNCGIYHALVDAKKGDRRGSTQWEWGRLEAVPTADNLVNQIAWKDNALVLLLTTIFTGSEFEYRIRKRPTASTIQSQAIRRRFGMQSVKELNITLATAAYNDHMGAVDIGDRLRSYSGYSHQIRCGPWRALAWTFLLDVVLINTHLSQLEGVPEWQKLRSQRVAQYGY